MTKYPSKRELAIAKITSEVAKHGIITVAAQRACVDNRLSYATFKRAANAGAAIYRCNQQSQVERKST